MKFDVRRLSPSSALRKRPHAARRELTAVMTVIALLAVACGGARPTSSAEAAGAAANSSGPAPAAAATQPVSRPSASAADRLVLATPVVPDVPLSDRTPRRASRVVVEDLGIDLPVVSSDLQPPPGNYPLCDVAQFLTLYGQPGEDGAAYIYAHAREGMFLPLLEESKRRGGAALIGLPVKVYTSDGRLYHYEIAEVERHSTSFHLADDVPEGEHRLILQTSEGPSGTVPKLVVAARFLSDEPADETEANPEARPRDCRPGAQTRPLATDSPTAPDVPVASRVTVPAYGIDLPVVSGDLEVPGNRPDYPLCDVAQYLTRYRQPSQEGTTYLFAHARPGMFLPLLEESQRQDGAALLGKEVIVRTTDGQVHRYEIFRVERHSTDFSQADIVPAGERRLILQTSEGPSGTVPKLVVVARFVGSEAGDKTEANPPAAPRVCV